MAEAMLIDLVGIPEKWQRLMLHVSNLPETVVRCEFLDAAEARLAAQRMRAVMENHPGWFRDLLVSSSGSNVYVVKVAKAGKVVVRV